MQPHPSPRPRLRARLTPAWPLVASCALLVGAPSTALAEAPPESLGRDRDPKPAARLVGLDAEPSPVGFFATARGRMSLLSASDFPTDRDGTPYSLGATLDTQVRVRADYRHVFSPVGPRDPEAVSLALAYEHDLVSGVSAGGPAAFDGVAAPYTAEREDYALRVASATLTLGTTLRVAVGAMTSHWGLGLLANDGAHGASPGSALFSDPRGGDRVLRALVATGPHTDSGLVAFAALDEVLADDVLIGDDTARQAVLGLMAGDPREGLHAGLYGVYRAQRASDGDKTRVGVVDLYARYSGKISDFKISAAFEGALIFGKTDLAPTADHEEHKVLQAGAALRLTLDGCMGGLALDVLFASGDAAFDDDTQSGFKVDRNFHLGLLLNNVVLAARTARTPIRAADPALVGVPAEDLDRLPTRGAITNTLSFFPRGWYRPVDGVELYGGLLVALSASDESDAFNARLAGGQPTNALGGPSSTLIGTELDLGVRFAGLLWGTELALTLEGGMLIPGPGLTGPDGLGDDIIWGGRAILSYAL